VRADRFQEVGPYIQDISYEKTAYVAVKRFFGDLSTASTGPTTITNPLKYYEKKMVRDQAGEPPAFLLWKGWTERQGRALELSTYFVNNLAHPLVYRSIILYNSEQ
jgi:hypothetical protein